MCVIAVPRNLYSQERPAKAFAAISPLGGPKKEQGDDSKWRLHQFPHEMTRAAVFRRVPEPNRKQLVRPTRSKRSTTLAGNIISV